VSLKGNYINGKFEQPRDSVGEWTVRAPGDSSDQLGKISYSYASVEKAVLVAKDALKNWKKTAFSDRAQYFRQIRQAILKNEDQFSEIIAREVGKPLWEAHKEVNGVISKIDMALEENTFFPKDFRVASAGSNFEGFCKFRPVGVVVVVGSFGSPVYLPFAHIISALLSGNTVVFKPSEKAAVVGSALTEFFDEAGFPAGVFNMIHGEREVGRRLCVQENVNAIFFTGSYEVGSRIKQDTLQQHWKLLVLQMGGKNPAIVWKDADLNLAIRETLTGAFITGGQRCTSTSRVIIHNSLLEEFVERFHEKAKAFSIDNPLKNPFMGPLIDQTSVDRYMKFFGIAAREGSEIIMRGKILELDVSGNYVTPSICVVNDPSVDKANKSVYQQTEVIGPNIAVIGVDDLDHAVALANASQYGLVSSVFTKDQEIFQKCFNELEFGLVNWNESTITTSMRLPYMGLKKSGNHRPGELLAPLYCQQPVSTVQRKDTNVFEEYPGLNWKK